MPPTGGYFLAYPFTIEWIKSGSCDRALLLQADARSQRSIAPWSEMMVVLQKLVLETEHRL